jgi:hypothetical protein
MKYIDLTREKQAAMSGWGNLLLAAGWLKSLMLWVIKANRVPVAFAATTSM